MQIKLPLQFLQTARFQTRFSGKRKAEAQGVKANPTRNEEIK
jgi:hypothetical protein